MNLTKETINRNRLESRKDFLNDIIPRLKSGEIKIQIDFRGRIHKFSSNSKQVQKFIEGCQDEYSRIMNQINELNELE